MNPAKPSKQYLCRRLLPALTSLLVFGLVGSVAAGAKTLRVDAGAGESLRIDLEAGGRIHVTGNSGSEVVVDVTGRDADSQDFDIEGPPMFSRLPARLRATAPRRATIPSALLASLVAVALAFAPAPAAAQLQSEGVIYAYMSLRVGSTQQPVLVPIPAEQVRPDLPLQSTIPAAFGLLRYGKPATYGNASVTVSDALLAQERVAVNLDPNSDASSFEVIAAETVLTFTALGIETVVFPGWADDGLTAADISYATFTFTVPLWQALVGGRVHGADIMLPDGERLSASGFYERLEDGDPQIRRMALGILSSGDRVAAYYTLGVISGYEFDEYEAAVIPYLSDEDPNYRAAALNALYTSSDEDAWGAITTMMSEDPDPQLRQAAANALAASPVESYRVYEVFYRAQSEDPAVRLAAIGEMSTLDDDRVIQQLGAYLASPESEVRQTAADALHTLQAWDTLRAAMENAELTPEVRLVAATALADDASGDDKVAGLVYRGTNTVGDIATAAIDRLATVDGVDPRESIEGFLRHPDVNVAIYTAEVLASRGDEASLDALSGAGSDESLPLDLQFAAGDAAFQIVSALPSSRINDYANDRDPFLKRAAYRALGAMAAAGNAGSGAFDTLSAGLANSDPGIRGASARGLAAYGTAEALALIIGIEADPDENVRADVALALGNFPGEEFADTVSPAVVGYIESGDPLVVAAALEALAQLEQRQLLSVVLDKVQFPDARVRASAFRAAAALADPGELRPVINAIGAGLRDEEVPNRVLAAQLLGQFNDSLAVLSLSQVVNGPEPEVRYAAISALGRTRNHDAVGTLLALLEDPDREIRLAAVDALRELNLVAAIDGVQAQISRETDPVSAEALQGLVEHLQSNGI